MFKWLLIGLVFLAAGCARKMYESRTKEVFAGSSATHTSVSVSEEKRVEKDTVRRIAAPVENSRSEVADSSRLSTSLAWSEAVFRDGRLAHRIGNLPEISVPAKIVYNTRNLVVRDTLVVRDSVAVRSVEYVEKRGPAVWWKMYGALATAVILLMAWKLVKKHLR